MLLFYIQKPKQVPLMQVLTKVEAVDGDITEQRLGLSEEDER